MTSRARITLAISTAAVSLSLLLAPSAFAEDKMGKSDAMTKQDTMSNASMKKDGKDAMSKDSMSKDSMTKDSMSKDTMAKDAMSKDKMSKDKMSSSMAKDAMKKDDLKKDDMKK